MTSEDVPRKMTDEELRRALADMRARPRRRRRLPLHGLYAIEERWDAREAAERPLRGLEQGSRQSDSR
jgi:hypothetical protein